MGESFLIFFAIVGVIVLILVFAQLIEFIGSGVVGLIGVCMIGLGIELLVKNGGGLGAFGIFLALIGAGLLWGSISMIIELIKKG